MQLTHFRVFNYRCIHDSGLTEVNARTVLVGRNESGKSSLLQALYSLNPPGGMKDLSYVRDFPRQQTEVPFNDNIIMLETLWSLSEAESQTLASVFRRATTVSQLCIKRSYKAQRYIEFLGLSELIVNKENSEKQLRGIERATKHELRENSDKNVQEKLGRALTIFLHEASNGMDEPATWAKRLLTVLESFKQTLNTIKFTLSETATNHLQRLEQHAKEIAQDENNYSKAIEWVNSHLPVFIYLSDYPQVNGHQNLKAFLQRLEKEQLNETDHNFIRLCQIAELEPSHLAKLLGVDHQQRHMLTNRASAKVTQKIRTLWKNQPLKIRFHLDADYFDTLVSTPGDIYDIEVNLNERSRGFKWFFSFFVTFTADTAKGQAGHAILLLDEPGIHLHPAAQKDLLEYFNQDFNNTIIYTSHSPYMLPDTDLSNVRAVCFDAQSGTWVSAESTAQTLALPGVAT